MVRLTSAARQAETTLPLKGEWGCSAFGNDGKQPKQGKTGMFGFCASDALMKKCYETDFIRAWLSQIGETDPAIIATVLDNCDRDPEALDYFMARATQDREQTDTKDRENHHSTLENPIMLTVSENQTTAFEMPPAGPIAARCCRLIDLGSQKSEFQGKEKMQRKLLLSWELAELRNDGTPFQISRRFSLSLHAESSLRQFLQAWRGRPFTPEELAAFDLRKLLNAPAMLNIGHTERAGKQYANILSISSLPKGMSAPDLSAPPVVFDIDAEDVDAAHALLDTLSESLQATIAASPEWQARLDKANFETDAATGNDDDLAF